ncbi:hypothetical protein H6F32_03235 [Anabaena sp. FACHB-1237]|uniref:DUF4129 domain-containing protein n=1 Tax=Anabaena sp. FACHB-1237 TaxID=2692769 RepID=UPI0016801E64|nr:DUF4129 domain-containing protein [Anabaena sp. FACHB-1237]MBD2136622.1 hypothetical protein [Anabaena sp. FACHB-1237]
MSTPAFEKTNSSWEFSLSQQKIGEWLEYQWYRLQGNLPELPENWSMSPLLSNVLIILFWIILATCLCWVGLRLWREFSPYIYNWLKLGNYTFSDITRSSIISIDELLEKSQQFYEQGNYKEACRCLYLAMLQQLDQEAIIKNQLSRTDEEYLQLLKSNITTIQPYETLITTHERLCFSNYEILLENYQQCQQAYQQLFNNSAN